MKCILGKKLNMGQVWGKDGNVIPVTFVEAGPCQVVQVKTKERDGYDAVQLGLGVDKHPSKPLVGHTKDLPAFEILQEVRNGETAKLQRGDSITVEVFVPGDMVDVIGTSKGKGFQGVVRRHHFHGHPKSHGHKDQERMPGSIGAGGVQRVFKGRRMAGRMGGDRVTVKNLEVVAVDPVARTLAIRGALPGARRSLVMIKSI